MMSQCFIVLPAITEGNTIIFGRNSLKNEECNEVILEKASDSKSEKVRNFFFINFYWCGCKKVEFLKNCFRFLFF